MKTPKHNPSTINWAKVLQVSISCFLMFLTGSTFSLGIFTLPVERMRSSLRGAWPFGMGLMHLLSAPVLIISGFVLDHSKFHSSDVLLRMLSIVASVAYGIFALCTVGIYANGRLIITTGLAAQSLPLGIFYSLCTEHLFAWYPDKPGLAVGLSQLAFGLGSIVMAWFYSLTVRIFGTCNAIVFCAILFCAISFVPSLFLKWPTCSYDTPGIVESVTHDEQLSLLNKESGQRLSWNQLVFSFQFVLYIMVVLTAGVSYAFIPYYFKLGSLFNASDELLLFTFQITSIAATFFGMVTAMWTDHVGFSLGGIETFSSGSKNVMGLFLILQTLSSLSLVFISRCHSFVLFVVVVALMKMIMASHAGCAALIARDIFGTANSCIVFGIGAGIALGTGEGLSAALMTMVESKAIGSIGRLSPIGPSDYEQFYWIATGWSAIGTVSLVSLNKFRKAFK